MNLGRAFRLAAIVGLALHLGACIYSDYDLASSLTPEFPVKPGVYVNADTPDTVIDIRRAGNAYRVYNRRTKRTTYARLYRIPEFSDYLLQYYDRKEKPVAYFFLKTADNGFDIYMIERMPSLVPEHLIGLLQPITEDDKRDNSITIANGRRDTLYVVRELVRTNPKMSVADSYRLQPGK
jgi:hypothetical protein